MGDRRWTRPRASDTTSGSSPLRRRLILATAISAGAVVLAVVLVLALYPRLAAWVVRSKVLPRVEARIDRNVTAGDVDVGRGRAVLRDVVVTGPNDGERALARIERVTIDFDFWASLRGDARIHEVAIEGLEGVAVRNADDSDNFRDLVDRLRARGGGEGGEGGAGGLRPEVLVVTGGSLAFGDAATGATMAAGGLSLRAERGGRVEVAVSDVALDAGFGPKARADRVSIGADMRAPVDSARLEVAGGRVDLWQGMSLTGIAGSIARGDGGGGRLAVDLAGGYGGVEGRLWQAEGWIDPSAATASVRVEAERFTLDRIDAVLADSIVVDYDATSVDANLRIDVTPARVDFGGELDVSGLNVFHPLLTEEPVADLAFAGTIAGALDRENRQLEITRASLHSRGIEFELEAFAHLRGGVDAETKERRTAPRLGMTLVIPPMPCQQALEAIPPQLAPTLQGFRLRGTFEERIRAEVDWTDLQLTRLSSAGGIFRCKVIQAPKRWAAERLAGPFVHQVEVERDNWLEFTIGPDNPDFVPLEDVSPHLVNSLMTTEDSRFYHHKGFINAGFRSALIRNLEAGHFRYGNSSITMQMVKNVILYRDKTLSRKLQELFFTWYVETELSKDRIMEIYVNAIEFGPRIYGIGPAARHYFGKHPRDLNPVESAFFSSILPNPKGRYRQYCRDELSRWTTGKIERIVNLMLHRGRLTEEEHLIATVTPLVFDRTAALPERRCLEMVKTLIESSRPTNPLAQ
jgi:hypothetical protein